MKGSRTQRVGICRGLNEVESAHKERAHSVSDGMGSGVLCSRLLDREYESDHLRFPGVMYVGENF